MTIPFRTGSEEALAAEFIHVAAQQKPIIEKLENPFLLINDNILAVHYADAGAQGDAGAVEILYFSSQTDVKILYGNYAKADLDLDAVIRKLPMLKCLDSRGGLTDNLPYPFGAKLILPSDWGYFYMGALNHFFARNFICDRTGTFIRILANNRRSSRIFDAVAWICGAPFQLRPSNPSPFIIDFS